MKSGRLLLALALAGALGVTGISAGAQVFPDSSAVALVPFFDHPIDPNTYLIRPGEQLEVAFINSQLSPLSLTVDAESRIVHQKLGIIDLAGKTLTETRQLLQEPLARIYNADKIDISIRKAYPVSIQVTGAVRKPGRYVGYTSQTVSDMVDSAGGVAPGGSTRNVEFIAGERILSVDLDQARFQGDSRLNPNLYAGNRVHVPAASGAGVYMTGEVNDPRSIELIPGDSLDLLIQLAGGTTPWGDAKTAYAMSDSTRNLRTPGGIYDGDFIVVPRVAGALAGDALTIVGAIANPGRYPWNRGGTVQSLLDAAGGLSERGNPDRIVVFRQVRDEVLGTRLSERFPMQTAGTGNAGDLKLEPADSVIVASKVGYVRVSGQVANPGVYPFIVGQNAGHYLSLAGGIVPGLDRALIYFRDPISNLIRMGSTRDPIYDGVEIIVREQEAGQ